jgi:SAM-dependent methyltransferase
MIRQRLRVKTGRILKEDYIMETSSSTCSERVLVLSPIFSEDEFSRLDESNDTEFYAKDRFVSHLDSLALSTVESLIGDLVIEKEPVILDLMAGWDSHIPDSLKPSRVVGLGLNENELRKNKTLTEHVILDINKNPDLPFPEGTFDIVVNTVSVDYMTRPLEIFKEVARVLKHGGLFLVIFSNRMFPEKAFKLWRESDEDERVILVDEFFNHSGAFEKTRFFASKGKPRPRDDKYSNETDISDPIYSVYAEKKGGDPGRRARPEVAMSHGDKLDRAVLEEKKARVKKTLRCPHCDEKLSKWEVPDNPFCQTWDNDFMYICFNDGCPYFVRGWDRMYRDTNQSMSYRLMYNPEKDTCMPMPVPTRNALKDGIVE